MAIGRSFKEAFLKGLRSLEVRGSPKVGHLDDEALRRKLIIPNAERIYFLYAAIERGWTLDELYDLTRIDPWFLFQLKQIVELQRAVAAEDFLRSLTSCSARRSATDSPTRDLLSCSIAPKTNCGRGE
jgi:carbamoyl-phosphate synthase large subunit